MIKKIIIGLVIAGLIFFSFGIELADYSLPAIGVGVGIAIILTSIIVTLWGFTYEKKETEIQS